MEEDPDSFADYRMAPEQIRKLEFEAVPNGQDVLLYSQHYDVPLEVKIPDVLSNDGYIDFHVTNILVRLTYSNGPKREAWLCRNRAQAFDAARKIRSQRPVPMASWISATAAKR